MELDGVDHVDLSFGFGRIHDIAVHGGSWVDVAFSMSVYEKYSLKILQKVFKLS